MLKRQDSLLSSSRRQTTPTPPPPEKLHHAKSVGCMSGIFHLISKYQNRHKLLTFGRKRDEKKTVSIQSSSSSAKEQLQQQQQQNNHKIVVISIDKVQNSDNTVSPGPALSQNIRRTTSSSNGFGRSTAGTGAGNNNNNNNPPALVARLMGLEEVQPAAEEINKIVERRESNNEVKRQRLLQALEKCNEDLEALKKIIVSAQASKKNLIQSTQSMAKKEQIINDSNSPLNNYYNKFNVPNGNLQQQGKKMAGKKPGEEDDGIDISFLNRVLTESLRIKRKAATTPSFWSSKAMIQSVDEVCSDIAWGEKREMGNIGLTLQNQIFKDLIEDFVKELGFHFMYRLPFDACKRRLSFK